MKNFEMQATESAKLTARLLERSDRSVRKWRSAVIKSKGSLPKSKQGTFQRNGVLSKNEELTEMARKFVTNNSSVKGKPNVTTFDFCRWVNESLLQNVTLEPGFPRKVSISTCNRWLHVMGFEVITPRKGPFIDGHERPDVVEDRTKFLNRMVKLGFLNLLNAPDDKAKPAIPVDIEPPTVDKREKTVYIFHTFNSNEDHEKKSRGAGIMVSDFVDNKNGMLALSSDEYERAKQANPNVTTYAREYLEYGENREGYWNLKRSNGKGS